MITDIKLNGFNRIKAEVEEKIKIRSLLENDVNSLENSLKILKSHGKSSDVNNSKLIKENEMLYYTGEVIIFLLIKNSVKKSLFFFSK
jgi:hypothetical protein